MGAIPVYLALGAIAGLLAGLLGVGGGLVIVAALVWLLPQQGVPQESVMHAALATSLASIVVTAFSSARSHMRRGSVMWASVWRLVPGLLIGGALGGFIAAMISGEALRWGVAVFCLVAAAQLTFGQPSPHAHEEEPKSSWLIVAGVLIGVISALVGIGGGSMTVPLLIALGAAPVRAVGSSSACGVAIGISAAVSYALAPPPALPMPDGSIGYIFLPAAIGIAVASLLVAPAGVKLAHRLPGALLKKIFALLLVGVAIRLILSG
jgi:uncharacterized membrane protein YfcA